MLLSAFLSLPALEPSVELASMPYICPKSAEVICFRIQHPRWRERSFSPGPSLASCKFDVKVGGGRDGFCVDVEAVRARARERTELKIMAGTNSIGRVF